MLPLPETVTSAPVPPLSETESILQEADRLVNGPRRASYGPAHVDFGRTAGMVSAMLSHKLKEAVTPEEIGMIMICVKLSRQVSSPKRDNCVDGAGYFACVHQCCEARGGGVS